jgi:hypothetical protein
VNFNQFIKRIDDTLIYLYYPKSDFLFCDYINVDYLNENNWKKQHTTQMIQVLQSAIFL